MKKIPDSEFFDRDPETWLDDEAELAEACRRLKETLARFRAARQPKAPQAKMLVKDILDGSI